MVHESGWGFKSLSLRNLGISSSNQLQLQNTIKREKRSDYAETRRDSCNCMVMDDTDTNGDYELYNEDNTVLSGLFSCLYAYTFGSCWYFKNADREEIELKPMTSSDQINDNGSNLGEGRGRERADCRMKKRIQYHFMDHIRRWMDPDQRRFPWKVILHLLLVVLVTTQVTYTYLPGIPPIPNQPGRLELSNEKLILANFIQLASYCQLANHRKQNHALHGMESNNFVIERKSGGSLVHSLYS